MITNGVHIDYKIIRVSGHHYDIGVKGQGQICIKSVNCLTACNMDSSFIFQYRVFIFRKMVVYSV